MVDKCSRFSFGLESTLPRESTPPGIIDNFNIGPARDTKLIQFINYTRSIQSNVFEVIHCFFSFSRQVSDFIIRFSLKSCQYLFLFGHWLLKFWIFIENLFITWFPMFLLILNWFDPYLVGFLRFLIGNLLISIKHKLTLELLRLVFEQSAILHFQL